jgi:outer membrane protein
MVVKMRRGWALLPLVLLAGTAMAELKIAVIDTQRALLESEEARQILQAAQNDLQADQNQLQTLGQQILSLREQYQKDAEVMSDADQRRRQKEIEDKQTEYQFLGTRLEREVNERRQELAQQMVPKLEAVLRDITESEQYDLILERGAVMYADAKHDITRRVTELLNERRTAGR